MAYIRYTGIANQSFEWTSNTVTYRYSVKTNDVMSIPDDQVGYLMGFGNFFEILNGYVGAFIGPEGVAGMTFMGPCEEDDILTSSDTTGRTLKSSGYKIIDLLPEPGTVVFKGDISSSSGFPTTSAVEAGWFYRITADVTDNNISKTNTGLSFVSGDEIVWVGSTWVSTYLPLPANMVTALNLLGEDKIVIGDGDKGVEDSGYTIANLLPTSIPEMLVVSLNGNDTTGTGTFAKPLQTIQKAFDLYAADITVANWYKLRMIYITPGIYNENIVIPPGRFAMVSTNCIINGNVTIKRSDTLQNTSIDPLTGTHTDRMRHTVRFEGGSGQESSNYDGGIMIYGDLVCSHALDDGFNTLELYGRNMVITGSFTPNDSTSNPTKFSGGVSAYFHSCRFNDIHSPISSTLTMSAWDCRVSGSIMSHPLGTATYGKIQFDSWRDTSVATVALSNGDVGVYSSGDRQALCNVRFNAGTGFNSSSAITLKVDAATYTDLMALGLTTTNITFSLIDQAQGVGYTPASSSAWITSPTNIKDALDRIASKSNVTVTVGASGADFTSLNAAIDFCSAHGGGTIIFIDQIYYYTAGTAKTVSNITFIGGGGDQSSGPGMIFWNAGAGAWTGNNIVFKNLVIRGRPGSSGSLLTLSGIAGTGGSVLFCDHCQFIIDGSTSPSLATSLFNMNALNCRVYLQNTTCTRSAPGNRSIFSGDSNTEFFLNGRSVLTGSTPKTVYRDGGSYTLYGTVTTDSLIDSSDKISYTPADGSKWTDPDPTTIQSALDRIASLIVTLNSGNPIP